MVYKIIPTERQGGKIIELKAAKMSQHLFDILLEMAVTKIYVNSVLALGVAINKAELESKVEWSRMSARNEDGFLIGSLIFKEIQSQS